MTYVIAHRGACRIAPENTVAAFQAAVDMGVDGIETDVQLTRDGQLVMHHNYYVDGTTADATGKVSSYSLEELRRMDFGSHKGPEFAGTQIATLDECLDATSSLRIVNIELKAPRDRSAAYVEKVVDAIQQHGMLAKVIISAFDHSLLREVKELCPELRVGALSFAPSGGENSSSGLMQSVAQNIPQDVTLADITLEDLDLSGLNALGDIDIIAKDAQSLIAELLEALVAIYPSATISDLMQALKAQVDLADYVASLDFTLDYLHPDFHSLYIDPSLVERLATLGCKVSPYTPDDEDDLRKLLTMGCYSIITNRPDLLLTLRKKAEHNKS